MTKRFGFTLAEVLITLGIIGVVAAMTMPTLINQTNGAQYKAAYKKALSAISQGVTLNVALEDLGFAEVDNNNVKLYENILQPRMNIVSTTNPDANTYKINNATTKIKHDTSNTTLFFNDGSMFEYKASDAVGCSADTNLTAANRVTETGAKKKACSGFIDVNGLKGPNKIVTCDTGTEGANCAVKSPTDIYPVYIYDQTILPATDAARAVLYGK